MASNRTAPTICNHICNNSAISCLKQTAAHTQTDSSTNLKKNKTHIYPTYTEKGRRSEKDIVSVFPVTVLPAIKWDFNLRLPIPGIFPQTFHPTLPNATHSVSILEKATRISGTVRADRCCLSIIVRTPPVNTQPRVPTRTGGRERSCICKVHEESLLLHVCIIK